MKKKQAQPTDTNSLEEEANACNLNGHELIVDYYFCHKSLKCLSTMKLSITLHSIVYI